MNALSKKQFATALVVAMAFVPSFAFAADFSLDVSSILTAITVIIAAVTSVGLGALSVVLVTKAFKYVRSAF